MKNKHTVILIHPPNSLTPEGDQEFYPSPPLGLMVISSVLKMHGYDILIVDLRMEAIRNSPFELLKDIIITLEKQPLAAGITTYTENYPDALLCAKIVKEISPNTKVIMGGHHATFCYEEILTYPFVDFIVRGEGEGTIIELLEYIKHPDRFPLGSIRGIAYRKDGSILTTAPYDFITNLDVLPFPDYDFSFNDTRYGNNLPFISSRGCPSKCIFCASRAFSGSKYRLHSAEWLFCLIYYYYTTQHLTGMMAIDDTFTASKKRLKKFCNYLIKNSIMLGWGCRSRVDALSEEIIDILKKSHCVTIHVGIESCDQVVLNSLQKNINLSQVFNVLKLCRKYGVRIEASFMIGNPTDTVESMTRTIILAKIIEELNIGISAIGISTPYPGTLLYKSAEILGIRIVTKDWRKYTCRSPVYETSNFTLDDLRKLYFYGHCVLRKKDDILPPTLMLPAQEVQRLYVEILEQFNENRK